ncbi:hypothetical protein CH251_16380 [Rhodococcus sp. 06-462-5]|uniref:DUF1707 SHOCT-like domain-containing protein n=1 Tax=unclassified Rhodococcus (in: high G+C Gram-positive bacteria) TaxID=192944 RepID=UPI000B9B4379|nr:MULTISPECIES: DUF1707 domain-containing protein [unclassified Rhodococcus (in: high G+C Gram-positive bacteria)]OZC71346.1 hypothetical protein CH251_16380 [Rhodococcus sp. 06-462-5]OZE70407.1 hypothetical protein CH270_00110 [Rhodococcus sp. 02-925g]
MGKNLDKNNRPDLRVSNDEREAVVTTLGLAMSEGRLTLVEYEQRLDAVWASTTRGDLAEVVRDLPAPENSTATDVARTTSEWREYLDEWRWWLGGAVVMNGIWAVQWISDGEPTSYWPLWPLGIWGIILVAMVFMPEDKKTDD